MAISKKNYIHNNKGNITIGIKGEKKTVFSKKTIFNSIQKVQNKSIELSQKLSKNEKFPEFLGNNTKPTKILNDITNKLDDILNNRVQYDPNKINQDLKDLISTAKNNDQFEKKFYKEVMKYYDTELSIEETKRVAKIGLFKYIPSDRGKYKDSDPTRLQNWIINHLQLKDPYKIAEVRRITDITELKFYIQAMEIDEELGV